MLTDNYCCAKISERCKSHADVAELADAPDLGSGGRPCRFDSCYPHFIQKARTNSPRLFTYENFEEIDL